MNHKYLLSLLLLISTYTQAQFDPPAGKPGSLAVSKDSSIISFWASNCTLNLGYQQCTDTSLGKASIGNEQSALGEAGTSGVVSLGDGGSAIISFDVPIKDVDGADFAVFENSFLDDFLELAFVEVSSNGVDFVRFPSISLTPTDKQIGSFDAIDATKIYNLAGKYKALYGTPFDLNELKDSSKVDILNITHIKIIDVIGIINSNFTQLDSKNNPINDPWPTPFASSGFDLDAVAALNQKTSSIDNLTNLHFKIYPNPNTSNGLLYFNDEELLNISLYNQQGVLITSYKNISSVLKLPSLKIGMYYLVVDNKGSVGTYKLFIK